MKDEEKTPEQLIHALAGMRQPMGVFKAAEAERIRSEREHIEAALRESEERYRSLFRQAAVSRETVDGAAMMTLVGLVPAHPLQRAPPDTDQT